MGKKLDIATVKKVSNYWKQSSSHDYKTMQGLFRIRRYSDSLFYCHLSLEKILKSFVVFRSREHAPHIHDLVRLAELAKISLDEDTKALLNAANDFNIRARYPEHKFSFYKKCTKRYTEKYKKPLEKLYRTLCREFMQKK